jgi:hypothetical protein
MHNFRQQKANITIEQTMKVQRGSRGNSSTLSLTSALDGVGGQRHAHAALPAGYKPGTHCTWGWVGPRDGQDGSGMTRPHRDSILG